MHPVQYEGDFINTMLTPTQKRYVVVLRRFTEKKPEAAASIPGVQYIAFPYFIYNTVCRARANQSVGGHSRIPCSKSGAACST